MATSNGSKISLSFSATKPSTSGDKITFECSYDGKPKDFPTINVLRESFELFKERKLSEEAILEVSETTSGRLTICDFQRNSVKSGRKTEILPERDGTKILFSISSTTFKEFAEILNENDIRLYIGYLFSAEKLQNRNFGILCNLKVFGNPLTTVSFLCPEEQIDSLLFVEKESKEKVVLSTPEYSLIRLKEKDKHKLYVTLFDSEGLIHPYCGPEGKYEEFWKNVMKELKIDFTKISFFICPRICAEVSSANASYFLFVRVNESKECLNNVLSIIKSVVSGITFCNENDNSTVAGEEKESVEMVMREKIEGKKEEKESEDKNDENLKYVDSVAGSIASIITLSQNTDFRMKALMLIYGRLVSDSELNEEQIKSAIVNLLNN